MKPAFSGSGQATPDAPTMVFSHPTAEEEAAHVTDRGHRGDAARNVTFTTPATTGESQPRP